MEDDEDEDEHKEKQIGTMYALMAAFLRAGESMA